MAVFLAFPGKAYHIAPSSMIAKLYSNSLVTMLNARSGMSGGGQIISGDVSEMQVARRSVGGSDMEGGLRGPIKITTTTLHQVSDRSDKSVRVYDSLNALLMI